uniref:A-kinase anchor protein 7-like phosphoesterase domain-containing protein n=1 Tax=Ditylenchus dipsaci TaxID=166011 RepID=A0A915CYM6_9BILA
MAPGMTDNWRSVAIGFLLLLWWIFKKVLWFILAIFVGEDEDQSKLHIQFHVYSEEIQKTFAKFFYSTASLHVTMLVVENLEKSDMHRAERALENAVKVIRKKYKKENPNICFDRLSSFCSRNNQVLYAAASQKDGSKQKLFEIKEILKAQFIKEEISVFYEKRPFHPHITIVNVKDSQINDELLVSKWKPFENQPNYFGTEVISGFKLSSMSSGKHECLHQIALQPQNNLKFPVLGFLTTLNFGGILKQYLQ